MEHAFFVTMSEVLTINLHTLLVALKLPENQQFLHENCHLIFNAILVLLYSTPPVK